MKLLDREVLDPVQGFVIQREQMKISGRGGGGGGGGQAV